MNYELNKWEVHGRQINLYLKEVHNHLKKNLGNLGIRGTTVSLRSHDNFSSGTSFSLPSQTSNWEEDTNVARDRWTEQGDRCNFVDVEIRLHNEGWASSSKSHSHSQLSRAKKTKNSVLQRRRRDVRGSGRPLRCLATKFSTRSSSTTYFSRSSVSKSLSISYCTTPCSWKTRTNRLPPSGESLMRGKRGCRRCKGCDLRKISNVPRPVSSILPRLFRRTRNWCQSSSWRRWSLCTWRRWRSKLTSSSQISSRCRSSRQNHRSRSSPSLENLSRKLQLIIQLNATFVDLS